MIYDSAQDTMEHIAHVREFLQQIRDNIETRAAVHDRSKLESPEKEMFDEFTPKLRALTYGSDEYKSILAEMGPALEHHYANNSHHPEHYGYLECDICFTHYPLGYEGRCKLCMHGTFTTRPDVGQMSLLDILEMLADWKAAGLRHADGNFAKSLEINKSRFDISDQLQSILLNTAKELNWL